MRDAYVEDLCKETGNARVALAMLDAACAKGTETQIFLMAHQCLSTLMKEAGCPLKSKKR